jgi:hypothetical protein
MAPIEVTMRAEDESADVEANEAAEAVAEGDSDATTQKG